MVRGERDGWGPVIRRLAQYSDLLSVSSVIFLFQEEEGDFFRNFVVGSAEEFPRYLENMRRVGGLSPTITSLATPTLFFLGHP